MAERKGGSHRGHDDKDALEHAEQILDEAVLEELYAWVDSIPLSRPKKNITRDFSDGGIHCLSFFLLHLWNELSLSSI